jgi:hypothetical protein
MNLTLSEGYWIKFCLKMIAVISHDNTVGFIAPFIKLHRQFVLAPNRIKEYLDSDSNVSPAAGITYSGT